MTCKTSSIVSDLPETLLTRIAIFAGAPASAWIAELCTCAATTLRQSSTANHTDCFGARRLHFAWRKAQQLGIAQRIAANRHVVALGLHGGVLAFGWNHAGQLGTGDLMERLSPSKVEFLPDEPRGVMSVSVAMEHSVLVDACGQVWGWGLADGRFGQYNEASVEFGGGPHFVSTLKPCPIMAFQHVRICSVACSSNFSLFLTDAGDVFQSNGYRGGAETMSECHLVSPCKVANISYVVQVSAGSGHALALTDTGSVFAWGASDCGQCGQISDTFEHPCRVPIPIRPGLGADGIPPIVALSAGGSHSLVISREGQIFTWGRGCWGQLGHGDYTTSSDARLLLDVPTVQRAKAGNLTTLILALNGSVFGTGRNYEGQLGRGETQSYNRPIPIPVEEVSPDSRVIDICAGRGCSYFILSDGGVLACGCGYNGRLGLGSRENVYRPRRIIGLTVS